MTLMKKFIVRLILLLSLLVFSYGQHQNSSAFERTIKDSEKTLNSQWNDIYDQAFKLKNERSSDIDAIFIFAGTNDYNS